jgi:WD40 repeat protein
LTDDSDSIEELERKQRKASNTCGDPVKFPTKILAVDINHAFDPSGDAAFVAEAAGFLTGLRLSTNELSKTPPGPKAPLTCLASHAAGTSMTIYAGCWDKSIWTYKFQRNTHTGITSVGSVASFGAHADFVKSLTVAYTPDRQPILISGGADGDLRFWTSEGQTLAGVKPQARAIECIVADPFSPLEAPIVMFSTSQREIYQVTLPPSSELNSKTLQLAAPIIAHETSVYKLHFDNDGDLWTASADKTAKRLVRENGWAPDTVLQHPDFVRDVITHDQYGLVMTACRDEEVRVWDKGTGSIRHVFSGHFEEVTGLALSGDLLISVSIDATLRRWSLAPQDLRRAIEAAKNPVLTEQVPVPESDLGMLTAEEEAELRALMEGEEADTLEKMAKDEQ